MSNTNSKRRMARVSSKSALSEQVVSEQVVSEKATETTTPPVVTDEAQNVTSAEEQQVVASDGENATESPAEVTAPATDPFADLPTVTIGEFQFKDLTEALTSDPRKYEGVHREARELKSPVKKGWKHSAHMIAYNPTSGKEFKPGSVYGTIDQICRNFGRAGVPAYVLVAKVRQAQKGNKRSHYCNELPPIGWGEGWVDTYISKGYGKVLDTPAPAFGSEAAEKAAAEADKVELAA